jgi:hypothetical protein
MSIETPYEDHYIQAFETAKNKLPDTISLKQAKSAIRKFIARTDPRLKGMSVSERRRNAARENGKNTPQYVFYIAKKEE